MTVPPRSASPGRKRRGIDPQFLLAVAVFAILLAVGYRDDASTAADSRFFLDVVQSPIVAALKSVSIVAFAVPMLATGLILLSRLPVRNVLGALTLILTVIGVFLVLRMLPSAPNQSIKILVGSAVFALLVPLAMCTAAVKGREFVPRAIHAGALAFALLHVTINALMAAVGQGFHDGRFLGTTVHPNFIGVQMAGCAMILTAGLSGGILRKAIVGIGLAGALTVLVLTGSRTGLLTFSVAFLAFWLMRGIKLWQVALLAIALVLFGTFGALGQGVDTDMQQFERGAGGLNTREASWNSMWEEINDSPLLGQGEFPTSSESSYLRGWATAGILYVVAYLGFLCALLWTCFGFYRMRARSPGGAVFAALLLGLLTGAFLEGYLLDTLSLSVFFLLMSALSADADMLPSRTRPRSASRRRQPVNGYAAGAPGDAVGTRSPSDPS